MKLKFNVNGKCQPDPFIFEDGNMLYMYVTANDGVEAYASEDLFGEWEYKGIVARIENVIQYWAPSVIKIDNKYYIYFSCESGEYWQRLWVMSSDSPLGPFENGKRLYDYFSIDSHMVKTDSGLFMWYALDNLDSDRIGTRVFVDKFIDPYTPCNNPKEVIVPTFEEELFENNHNGDGRNWYTIEGPFWFKEGDWQYVMYSGGCFENDTYHIGYSAAKTTETDLTKIDFVKNTDNGKFSPVLIKNEFEEGVGHHSVIKYKGEYYAIYHGRDYADNNSSEYVEARTARVCKLKVDNGKITAERYKEHI